MLFDKREMIILFGFEFLEIDSGSSSSFNAFQLSRNSDVEFCPWLRAFKRK